MSFYAWGIPIGMATWVYVGGTGERISPDWRPCPITLTNERVGNKTKTLERIFQGGIEGTFDGSYRSLQVLSSTMQSIGREHAFRHDKITYPQFALSKSSLDNNKTLLTGTWRQCETYSEAIDDQYLGQWRWASGSAWGTFGIAKYWGRYQVSHPWGECDNFFVPEKPGDDRVWYMYSYEWDSNPTHQSSPKFDTGGEAFAWAMEQVGIFSHLHGKLRRVLQVYKPDPLHYYAKPILCDDITQYENQISWSLIDENDDHPVPLGLDGQLAVEAINSINFNTNNIANVFAIKDLIGTVLHPGEILENLTKHRSLFERSKNAWLQYRYVYSTTLSDIEEAGRFFSKKDTFTCRAGSTTDTGEMHVKVLIRSPGSDSQSDILNKYGLSPDLYNLWDMVPYSFVIDWFVGIGDFLEQVTNRGKALKYDIISVTTSWKWQDQKEISIDGHKVKVQLEYYNRTVSPSLPAFLPYSDEGPSDKTIIKRCLDGVALFVG